MVDTQRIFYRSYAANLLRDDPGTKVAEAREKVLRFTAEMEQIKEENAGLREKHPELYAYLAQLAKRPKPYPDEEATPQPAQAATGAAAGAGAAADDVALPANPSFKRSTMRAFL